jgi:hypothetical protein
MTRPGDGGSSEPSLARKLFKLAHASINVPSTEKWSLDRSGFTSRWASTAAMNFAATSASSSRSRFFVNTVASHTGSSMPSPTNQRNSRLKSSCSMSWRSERTEKNACSSEARSNFSGAIDGRPSDE